MLYTLLGLLASTPLPGIRESLQLTNSNLTEISESIWLAMTGRWSQQLVVETNHAASYMLYLEYFIGDDGRPRFLNNGLVRLAPDDDPKAKQLVWLGLDLPAALPSFSAGTVIAESCRLASVAADLGYRGFVNIDAIVTDGGTVVFNEINARWGRLFHPSYHGNAPARSDVRGSPLRVLSPEHRLATSGGGASGP
jgi:hypothetical protein